MEIFQTFAEISIGILGFTSIVIMFKSKHANWNRGIFHGMIGHSIQAVVYSILPFILDAYHCKPATIWMVCSATLGTFTFLQGIGVLVGDKESKLPIRLGMCFFSSLISLVQLFNIIGIWTFREQGPFIVGITWHILQSLIIFSIIVTKKTDEDI